jgi:UDP-N-acetylglucosamine--N-acetylmuramyl-(pentapeptide) pyrophosphoryl-undecaprenol N-acetylglucosamine transferase
VGLAALLARVPLVLTEADSHLGLSNRLLARYARRVCLAFPPPATAKAGDPRYVITGRPVFAPRMTAEQARERFGILAGERCILVFGGSLGARSLNLAAVGGLPELLRARPALHVLHICGRRDHAELAARWLPERYRLIEYLDLADFDIALSAADLAIARSGGSVFELTAHGLPAVLIPYPHATGDHQSANARWMADAGAAVVIPDAELSAEGLREQMETLLCDPERLARMAVASNSLARPNAADEIAEELLAAAGAAPATSAVSGIRSGPGSRSGSGSGSGPDAPEDQVQATAKPPEATSR